MAGPLGLRFPQRLWPLLGVSRAPPAVKVWMGFLSAHGRSQTVLVQPLKHGLFGNLYRQWCTREIFVAPLGYHVCKWSFSLE